MDFQAVIKPTLPQEIIDHILDDAHIRHDIPTLSACTLVCSSWVPRSSCHLFKLRPVKAEGVLRLQELAATVQSSRRLALYVTAISIHLRGDDAEAIQDTVKAISDIVSALYCLEDLFVYSHPSVNSRLEYCDTLFTQCHASRPPLHRLTVIGAHLILIDGLLKLFPAVDALQLERVPCPGRPCDRQLSSRPIRRLVFRGDVDARVISDISALIAPAGVFSLSVDAPELDMTDLGAGPPPAVDDLVRIFGQQMTNFEYHHPVSGCAGSFDSLISCTQLQAVRLSVEVQSYPQGTTMMPWTACLNMLRKLPRDVARIQCSIGICFVGGDSDALDVVRDMFTWPMMEEVLAHCVSLKTVEVEFVVEGADRGSGGANWQEEARASIEEMFSPPFRAITHFSFR